MHGHRNENYDNWADDVSLLYKEDGWKPDDGELTMIEIEGVNTPSKEKASEALEESPLSSEEDLISPQTSDKKKAKPFTLFLLLWLGTLSIIIAVALGYFYDFLESYENAYQASRPYHEMEEIISILEERDLTTIYLMITNKPVITEFETTDNVYHYLLGILEGTSLDYTPTPNHLEDYPEYYITANGYIVATVALLKSQTEIQDYDFPVWYISSFDFYTEPQYDVRIEAPSNCSISINGIPLTDTYLYESGNAYEAASYVEGYADLPTSSRYYCDGLYEAPTITAYNCFGEETEVTFNTRTGFYEVSFGTNSAEAEEMQAYAIEVVSAYANYISNDLPEDGLDSYFVTDSEILSMIKAGTSRQYFASHHTPEIQNAEVVDFIVYSEDCYYCEVSLEQHMQLTYSSEPEIIPIIGRFYFVKIDGEWKVCNIQY